MMLIRGNSTGKKKEWRPIKKSWGIDQRVENGAG